MQQFELAADEATEAFDVVQEALSNARRHADAGVIGVRLEPASQAWVTVDEDGHGFDVDAVEARASACASCASERTNGRSACPD